MSSKRRGLPNQVRMRHDRHFVDALTNQAITEVGTLVPIDLIETNREQPRSSMGDLSELAASVKARGVLEPLLVRPIEGTRRYQLIAGERRLHAAREAGLSQVPCIELTLSDQEALEVALVENLQRKDLTPFEEADGYRTLVDKYDYTHEQVARAVGKSRTTVTEALKLQDIPPAIRDLCRHADITAKSVLLLIARADTIEEMERLVQDIAEGNLDRDGARAALRDGADDGPGAGPDASSDEPAEARSERFRPLRFRFRTRPDSPVHLSLSLRRPDVDRAEIIATLETLIEQLKAGELDEQLRPRDDEGDA